MEDNQHLFRTVIPDVGYIPPKSKMEAYTSAVDHFSSIPWTNELMNKPGIVKGIPQCRNPISSDHEQFFGKTLLHDDAVPHILLLISNPGGEDLSAMRDPKMPIREASMLFEVGDSLTGVQSVLHGGMVVAMADETMSMMLEVNTSLGKEGTAWATYFVTGSLDIRFILPVSTPGTIVMRAWMEETKGRKTKVRCEAKNADGEICATASSMWITIIPKM